MRITISTNWISGLTERLGEEYHLITKWHPALYNNIKRGIVSDPVKGLGDRVTDASGYGDINDLLTVSDVLVTDYSSVIFEWSLLDKPVVYFIYDIDQYRDSRGLYFDFEEYVYGRCAYDSGFLAEAIKAGNRNWKSERLLTRSSCHPAMEILPNG